MADAETVSLLVFQVGDLLCAAPTGIVQEIVPYHPPARIPGAVAGVLGLVNVRGRLITVADGRQMLGRDGPPAVEPSILLLAVGGRLLGLIVDLVHDLLHLPASALDERDTLPGVDPRLVQAVGRWDDRVFVVLDTETVLGPVYSA